MGVGEAPVSFRGLNCWEALWLNPAGGLGWGERERAGLSGRPTKSSELLPVGLDSGKVLVQRQRLGRVAGAY